MKWSLDRAWRLGLLTAVIVFLILGMLGAVYVHYAKASQQQLARSLAQSFSFRISLRTYETISPVYMLAAMVKQNQGSVPDFTQVATDLLQEFPLARALELAPAGVVREVYPLRGNEAVIGHDLLKDRGRNREAHLALFKRQLALAGPFELIQGGKGIVARYPVFLPGAQGKSVFWGFAIVLIHLDDLLANSGVMDFERKGFEYQLCRVLPTADPGPCEVFAQSGAAELKDPMAVTIELPNSRWQLSIAPTAGWLSSGEWVGLLLVIVGGALLAGVAHFQWIRQSRKPPGAQPGSVSQQC